MNFKERHIKVCFSLNKNKLPLDYNYKIRFYEDEGNWYFSVVDVEGILTDNGYQKSRNYWKWLKNKLNQEGSQLVSDTNQLKMKAHDGKLSEGTNEEK